MTLTELADQAGMTANLSILKTSKARAIRFTLDAICGAHLSAGRHSPVRA